MAQLIDQATSHPYELVLIRPLDRKLEARFTDPIFDRQILDRLHIELNARNIGDALLDLPDNRFDAIRTFCERFQIDLNTAGIQRWIDAVDADK